MRRTLYLIWTNIALFAQPMFPVKCLSTNLLVSSVLLWWHKQWNGWQVQDQSEASTRVTWSLSTNERPVWVTGNGRQVQELWPLWSHEEWGARGQWRRGRIIPGSCDNETCGCCHVCHAARHASRGCVTPDRVVTSLCHASRHTHHITVTSDAILPFYDLVSYHVCHVSLNIQFKVESWQKMI